MAEGCYKIKVWHDATSSFPWNATVTTPNGKTYGPRDLGAGGYDIFTFRWTAIRKAKKAVRLHKKYGVPQAGGLREIEVC